MATVTGMTAEAMQKYIGMNIVGGEIDGSGNLILKSNAGDTINAGIVNRKIAWTSLIAWATNGVITAGSLLPGMVLTTNRSGYVRISRSNDTFHVGIRSVRFGERVVIPLPEWAKESSPFPTFSMNSFGTETTVNCQLAAEGLIIPPSTHNDIYESRGSWHTTKAWIS